MAAQVLGIYAYQDRAFLTAGIPVPRLHVHVRRLVRAGHKVGWVSAGVRAGGEVELGLWPVVTGATRVPMPTWV